MDSANRHHRRRAASKGFMSKASRCVATPPWSVGFFAFSAVLFHAPSSPAVMCAGDCGNDGTVTVNEVITGVNIALGSLRLSDCLEFDANGDEQVTVNDIVVAVGNVLNGCLPTATATPTPTATQPVPTATPTTSNSASVPITAPELFAWLQAGNYRDWPAESGLHPSPVHGTVRVFVAPTLLGSLEAGLPSHPVGAAAVKELYSRGELVGWSVMVKVQDDSDGGKGWYWYEGFGASPGYSGRGLPVCIGCHSLGRDFFRSNFPLQ